MRVFTLVLLALLAFAPVAHAADEQPCDAAAFEVAGRFAGFADFSAGDGARVVSSACKAAPDQPGVLLAAFAYGRQPVGKPMPDDEAKELAVLMIDRAKRRVIASHKQLVEEDAATSFYQGSLSLDTARYLLAPGVRAFGLRLRTGARGASCADNDFGPLLTLFVPDGRALRPVLQMNVSTQRALSGCIGTVVDGAVVESAEVNIALATEKSHGYADLVVHAKIDTWYQDEKKKPPPPRSETRTLRFDGTSYPVPHDSVWWLADFGF